MGMQYERELHLLRGAPAVRAWSQYQATVKEWALCGIQHPQDATEEVREVSCEHCLDLMEPKAYDRPPRPAISPNAKAERDRELTHPAAPLVRFARQHGLHIRRDDCGEAVIPGRRGNSQLYFDGAELCLMVIDGPVALPSRWKALGGKLWLGSSSHGRQDVKITGTPLAHGRQAIRMTMVKPKRVMSEAQTAVLAAARKQLLGPGYQAARIANRSRPEA